VAVFEQIAADEYEQVIFNYDRSSGLRAIIAIHSTALGPALGGTRFYPYESEEEALIDVLRLAKGMTYKAAAAGLDLGGGKAVILGDPKRDKSEELFRAYGRFVETLGGRYITARAVAMELWKTADLKGRRFAVQGVGKVGYQLVKLLVEGGASVVASDVDVDRVASAVRDFSVDVIESGSIHSVECDVFAPCALGGVLNDETIPQLRCSGVAGGANNQLDSSEHAKLLEEAGILYAPDFIINAGGLINVADELRGYDAKRALAQVDAIFHGLRRVFSIAKLEKITTDEAAHRLAEDRIRNVGRIKLIQVGPRAAWP
jgi:leucine dehydrogenase